MNSRIISEKFQHVFGESPALLARSPGRINLLGEHIDYNDGIVLPAAIDKGITLAISHASSTVSKLYAADVDDSHEFDLATQHPSNKTWPNYFLGVIDEFVKRGFALSPVNCLFGGDLPIGAGLSSSAALEGGFAFAINELFGLELPKHELVKIAHSCENHFVGVQCGIMDQFANIFGMKDHILKLDCRDQTHELIEFNIPDLRLLLLDTQISHNLSLSEYNLRREQCQTGIDFLRKTNPGIRSLRDVPVESLFAASTTLEPVIFKRCKYVVEENSRVQQACSYLKDKKEHPFGELMFATHAGLRDEYEVSCPELDFLVDAALHHKGVIGARLMGAGFGGCTLNLIVSDAVNDFIQFVQEMYRAHFTSELKPYVVSLESGTSRIA